MASNPWTLPEIERAIHLYSAADMSAAEVGQMLQRPKDGVLAVLRANNIPIRRIGRPKDSSANECLSFRRMAEEARFGSQMLLEAIQRAGVRP